MKSYLDLWRRAFDFKGTSTLREFWVPFGIHAALVVAMIVLFFAGAMATYIASFILAVFHIISAVPFAALTVRRLHDVGKSGWWYFLWYGLGVGAVVLMIILASAGGSFSFFDNYGENVYGPPEWFGVTVEPQDESIVETHAAVETPATATEQEATNPPASPETEPPATETPATEPPATEPPEPVEPDQTFDPAENIEVDVYGPPEWFGVTVEPDESNNEEETDEDSGEYNPNDNLEECVYGPPEWFE